VLTDTSQQRDWAPSAQKHTTQISPHVSPGLSLPSPSSAQLRAGRLPSPPFWWQQHWTRSLSSRPVVLRLMVSRQGFSRTSRQLQLTPVCYHASSPVLETQELYRNTEGSRTRGLLLHSLPRYFLKFFFKTEHNVHIL